MDTRQQENLRNAVSQLRKTLKAYYETDGKNDELEIAIPAGQKGRRESPDNYVPVITEKLHAGSDFARHFWKPYLTDDEGLDTVIIYTEPLFFRIGQGKAFIRFLDRNAETDIGDIDKTKMGLPKEYDELTPCYNYAAAGEVRCAYELGRFFSVNSKHHRLPQIGVSRRLPYPGDERNVVALGAFRTNRIVRTMQEDGLFRIKVKDFSIVDIDSKSGKKTSYCDVGFSEERAIYAVLARRPNWTNGVLTYISSNHARAYESVLKYVLSEKLKGIFNPNRSDALNEIPEAFQILFKIKVLHTEEPAGDPEPILFHRYKVSKGH